MIQHVKLFTPGPGDVEDEVLRLAEEKVGKENDSRRELLRGRTLRDVYNQYRVL